MKLYMFWGSPVVNSVLMVAKALNLELELKEMDHSINETHQNWFLKLNPAHTVPTLEDDGHIIWDSHAIICYLAEKCESDLYPKDLKRRTFINQILYFSCGTLFRKFSDCVKPIFTNVKKTIDLKNQDELEDAYLVLERLFESNRFFAGDSISVADISVLAVVSICEVLIPINLGKFPKLKSWLDHMKTFDFFQASEKGIKTIKDGYDFLINQ